MKNILFRLYKFPVSVKIQVINLLIKALDAALSPVQSNGKNKECQKVNPGPFNNKCLQLCHLPTNSIDKGSK